MGKSDVKIINIKNFKFDEDDNNSIISNDESQSPSLGGSDKDEEEYFEQEQKEDYENESDDIDPFLDSSQSTPKQGGYDDGMFEDGSEQSSEDYEFQQNAGKGPKAPPSISDSIVEELSGDPMFMVLTRFLMSKKGNSIADILEEIKDHLAFIRAHISIGKN